MVFLAILKWVLVFGLLAVGLFCLMTGLGAEVPFVAFKGLEARGLPAGVAILAVAVALAYFWRVRIEHTTETTETFEEPPGDAYNHPTKIERKKGTVTTFNVPGE